MDYGAFTDKMLASNKLKCSKTLAFPNAYYESIPNLGQSVVYFGDKLVLPQLSVYSAYSSAVQEILPENLVKKMHCDVDKLLNYNEKSVQLYQAIHEYSEAGYNKRAIAKILYCSRNTVTTYLEGDYDSLCCKNFYSGMD